MKTRLFAGLIALFSLFGYTAVIADNSYGHIGYAGNVSLGFVSRYANHGDVSVPYYGYGRGYRQGHHYNNHHGRHHYRDHHGRHHYNDRHGRHHYTDHHGRRHHNDHHDPYH